MNILRMLSFAVSCCLALAACHREPTFDASSLPAYQRSLSKIEASLSAADQDRLKIALAALAIIVDQQVEILEQHIADRLMERALEIDVSQGARDFLRLVTATSSPLALTPSRVPPARGSTPPAQGRGPG